ncbi:MAG: acyltransferase family protein [Nocardioides sp.]|uniref:acyltransferase family protein n=1 Tax=Nocardioides sp. TaxID=35761 RepID=UPI003F07F0F2
MRFRGDIQGMRALAVGLVILAHAGFSSIAGGFVGVDVFFVVSGFLIIGLLLREGQSTGRVSILDFYARRARRILPAATVTLVATALLAAYKWPFVRAETVAVDAGWAAAFLANFRFAAQETDYFAADEPPSPVQHFWSLSVEEQFYLVIPLVLMVVTALVVRRSLPTTRPVVLRRWALVVLGVLSAASLAWSIHLTSVDITAAYFSTLTRAWELGLGGLAAVLVAGTPAWTARVRRWHTEVLAWGGLLLIAYAAFRFDATTQFPGVAAMVPVLGAVAVLLAGSFGPERLSSAGHLLSLRPAQLVGAWSYSLYLWHWPVLLFAHEHWGRDLSRPQLLVVLVTTFAVSAASFYFVEEPFRRRRGWSSTRRAMLLYPISIGVVLASILVANLQIQSLERDRADNPPIAVGDFEGLSDDPAVAIVQASVLAAEEGRPIPGQLSPGLRHVRDSVAPSGDCDYREGMRRLCPTGDLDADRRIVVMGDSHGRAWGPAFTEIGEQHGYEVYHLVLTGCPANAATRPDPANGGTWHFCLDFKQWALEQVEELSPDLVVVANSSYVRGDMAKAQVDGLAEQLEALGEVADRVVMVGNTPVLPRMSSVCLAQRGVDLGDCLMTSERKQQRLQRTFASTAKSVGAEFLDARQWFCVERSCPAVIGKYVVMRDKDHMTTEYGRSLAEPVADALGLAVRGT